MDPKEVLHFIPFIASKNAHKDSIDLPSACFMTVDRIIDLKKRKNIFMKKESLGDEMTDPQYFYPKMNPIESSNLFSRVSCLGCSENENRSLYIALYKHFVEKDNGEMTIAGNQVLEFGLCKSVVKVEVLSIIYDYDENSGVDKWDAVHQSNLHEFLYFKLQSPSDSDEGYFFCDLSAIQYGVDEFFKQGNDIIPLLFGHYKDICETYGDVYGHFEVSKSSSSSENFLSLEKDLEKLKMGSEAEKKIYEKTVKDIETFSDILNSLATAQ